MDETPEIEVGTSLFSKRPEDLTVGEALKLNLGAMVVITAAPLVAYGVAVGVQALRNRWKNRKQSTDEKSDNVVVVSSIEK